MAVHPHKVLGTTDSVLAAHVQLVTPVCHACTSHLGAMCPVEQACCSNAFLVISAPSCINLRNGLMLHTLLLQRLGVLHCKATSYAELAPAASISKI